MSVPFDQIGTGQSGRLVYQVMGQDGPVFNPSGIRYLGPEEAQEAGLSAVPASGDMSSLVAGLAGVNLIASVGALAISAVVLKEVKRLSKKIDEIRAFSIESLDRLKTIQERLNVIDIKVSENNLRHALNHISKTCIEDYHIDLEEIKKLSSDLSNFQSSIDGWGYCSHAHFNLSSDVRDKLNSLHRFLYSLRETVARKHNLKSGGDPRKVLKIHPLDDYYMSYLRASGNLRLPPMLYFLDRDLHNIAGEVGQAVHDQFTWADEEDQRKYYEMVMTFGESIWSRTMEFDPISGHTFNGLYKLIDSADNSLAPEEAMRLCNDWENYWLLHTDMGLVYRLFIELEFLEDYQNSPAWSMAEPNSLGSNELLIDCKWSSSAAGGIKAQAKTKVPS